MDKTVYLSAEDFTKLWKDHRKCARITSPNIDPVMKNMTVQGKSGPGTRFENEYERLIYKHYNPDPPVQITVVGVDGNTVYKPERYRDSLALEIIETELRKKNSGHYSYSARQHAQDIWKALRDMV